jgi:predicted ABC-type ATPase
LIRPVLTIVAGSNGCGKTSLTTLARTKFQQAPVLDPDAIARSLRETNHRYVSDVEAGKQLLRQAEALIEARQSFTVETTLSGSTYLKMAKRAKTFGFRVLVLLVGTASVEINMARIQARVLKGGHDVPEADQRRRYPRTLANMQKLLPIADLAVIYDNSTDIGHTLVAAGRPGCMQWFEPVPRWAEALRTVR